jgi:hypothetical protein
MSIRTKLSVLGMAEADCAVRRASVAAAWRGLKQESERAATPGRIVGAGLVAGFLSGLPGSGSKSSGFAIGDKLFGMALEGAFASIGAMFAADTATADVLQGAAAAGSQSVADHG